MFILYTAYVIKDGVTEILKCIDTYTNTVSVNADAGNGAYALVRLK